MIFVHFLIDTPVVAFMLILVLLVTVGPIIAGWLSHRNAERPDKVKAPEKEQPSTRFLGTQMDIAILLFGLFLLLAVIGWIHKIFFS